MRLVIGYYLLIFRSSFFARLKGAKLTKLKTLVKLIVNKYLLNR